MLRTAAVLFALLTLSACCPITATNPLSAPQDAIYDARLTGAWRSAKNPTDAAYIHMGKGANNTIEVIGVEHHDDGKMLQEHFPMFISIVQQRHFLNIDMKTLHMEDAKGYDGYLILQYDLLDSKTLVISYMNEEVLAKAITDKKVAGRVTYDDDENTSGGDPTIRKIKCVYLTADTAALREFIASDAARNLFEPYVTLKRVRR